MPGWNSSHAVAVDKAGNTYWARTAFPGGHADIHFTHRLAGGSWGSDEKVNDGGGTARQSNPSIALDGGGTVYAVWDDARNGHSDIYFSYRPAGGVWQANEKVNDDAGPADQYCPALGVDAAGNVYVVWEDNRNGTRDVYFAVRAPAGSWSANVKVNSPAFAAVGSPFIAVLPSGEAYALWNDEASAGKDIYYAFRPAGGPWGSSNKVNGNAILDPETGVYVDGLLALWLGTDQARGGIFYSTSMSGPAALKAYLYLPMILK